MNTTNPARQVIRYLTGTTVVLLLAAGCGSDTDQTTGNAPADKADQPAASEEAELVAARDVDGVGTVLVDADGMALYTNEAESDGTIKCVDACAEFWPPLEGSESSLPSTVDGIDGAFGVIERPDGTEQVTLDRQPLYTFAEDRAPGSVEGDGFEDDFQGEHFVWHVVAGGVTSDSGNDSENDSDDGGSGNGYNY